VEGAVNGDPWQIGDRVRLAKPENPRHPRAGRVGTVIRTRLFPEVVGWGKVVENALWMAVVRFDPDCFKHDRFDELGVGAEWRCFEHELAKVEKGAKAS
jgi:hypothetical protein